MFPFRLLLPGLLLLSCASRSIAQTATPLPAAASTPVVSPVSNLLNGSVETPDASRPLLLRIGLNAGRSFHNGDFLGWGLKLPVAVGAEYALSSKFTLYGQLDADLITIRPAYARAEQYSRVPGASLGLGARYYYNQAGRARHNRAHGPFVGNYLALEAHLETHRYASFADRYSEPSLLLLWGAQRRLGSHFLLDLSAGTGLGYFPGLRDSYYPSRVGLTTQLNLGLYFVR